MWKKTMQTIRENPRMLWGFIIPIIVGLGLAFPIYRSVVLTLLGDYSRIDDVPNFQEVVRFMALASPFVYTLLGVFVLPPVYSYVYKAVTGEEKNVWTKDGFLKYSWRIVVKTFLGFFILFGVFVVLFFAFAAPTLGFTLYTVAFSGWSVFLIISLTSAIVEDKFINSLPNTFYVGKRYYFKMYFTCTAIMLPAIIVSTWFLVYFHGVGMDIARAVPTIDMNPVLLIVIFLGGALLLSIYYVFAQAFLFTYSMHNYIVERQKMYDADEEAENSPEEEQ